MAFLKNKYGSYVLQKSISYLSLEEKKEIKKALETNISTTSNKEKARLNNFINILNP